MTSIYAIPTHRKMDKKNINDYFSEVNFANDKYGQDCLLVFFEDVDMNINLDEIKEVAKKYKNVRYMYINRRDVVYIYNLIYNDLPQSSKDIFKKLYPGANVNYGNVFNRIFIFAILLGADKIHRRDSDVLIDIDANENRVYPIDVEMTYLGKKADDRIIYICGGGYKEKYDLDIEGLIKDNVKDYSLVKKLFTCMSIPETSHDIIIDEEILDNNKLFISDVINLDSGCYPECGNVSLYKLFRYFPSSTQDFVLGSDYFFIDVAEYTDLNICYHNRAVIHRHTNNRKKDRNKVYNYWKGFLMLIDSQMYYHLFYNSYLDNKKIDLCDPERKWFIDFMDSMKCNFDLFKKEYYKVRKNKLSDTFDVLSQAEDEYILSCLDGLASEVDSIIKYTNSSIEDHIKLMIEWIDIVTVIDEKRNSKEVLDFFANSMY